MTTQLAEAIARFLVESDHDDAAWIVGGHLVIVRATDDVDEHPTIPHHDAVPVRRPDGLREWQLRSDFVKLQTNPVVRKRLGMALRGPGSLPRFRRALATMPAVRAAFATSRNDYLREFAADQAADHEPPEGDPSS